jgi:uncharacterized protein
MVLKSEIERAFKNQKNQLIAPPENINRTHYKKLNKKSSHIDIIAGIRRCGKSTLMKQMMSELEEDFAFLNFEDPRIIDFDLSDFEKLDEIIGENCKYYFFDEIQNIPNWEIYVRQLHDRNKKVFITGSNASLLSKELGTKLTGRNIRHEIFPFSYQEFLVYKNKIKSLESIEEYIEKGGFPEFLRDENIEILQNLLKDIVFRDIAIRHGVRNSKSLIDISLYLISNIGKEMSYNGIRKTFEIGSTNSVTDYINWLEDSYLFFLINKFSWSAKKMQVNPKKVYAIDTGLVNANSLSFSKDRGRLLENMVFLELRRNYAEIYYFREKKECDFVVFKNNNCEMLVQVSEELNSDNKDREINGLIEAMDFFKLKEGLIITKNQDDHLKIDGRNIKIISIVNWIS